jgi:fucose 4-O-acetylase-like acetyltransferase
MPGAPGGAPIHPTEDHLMTREIAREGFVAPAQGATAPSSRFHYMDNLRALAMLAGIFFHAALAWSPLLSQLWLAADDQSSLLMEAFAWFSHLFRMPLFFLIAGFFACYLVGKRGPWGLLKHRALRIALPFVLFLPLIWVSLAMIIGWAMEHVASPSPMLWEVYDYG